MKQLFTSVFLCLLLSVSVCAEELSTDIVIVGAGTSGLSAALQAAQNGAKVIVIEKMPSIGGTGNHAEGPFGIGSKIMLSQKNGYTVDEIFDFVMKYDHWNANAKLIRVVLERSGDSIDWLMENGVTFDYVGKHTAPDSLYLYHWYTGLGAQMIKIISEKARQAGVEIITETPGKSLIKDKNGRIVGVIAEDADGEELRINAKAVIIGTGGYANNQEWLEKYTSMPNAVPIGNVGKTGDGIKMAWEAGAAEKGIELLQLFSPGVPDKSGFSGARYTINPNLSTAGGMPGLWINKEGYRFANESIRYNWTYSSNALAQQTEGTAFHVFDSNFKSMFSEAGYIFDVYDRPASKGLVDFDTQFIDGQKKGYAFKANSIKELAKLMGVNEQNMIDEVNKYNEHVKNRKDSEFAKDAKFLKPIDKGPFYAVQIVPTFIGTLGGVKIDHKMQALDKQSNPIPGLYVVGLDAGGFHGSTYNLLLPGGTNGFALNSGRIAADNALTYIKASK